ncbi:MAG: transketolase [Clostridiales bacterium]|nr:transketolase [Clostridiales bacterium]
MKPIELKTVNAIRILSAEGVQKANSGHPGLPMGSAPLAYALWAKHLKFNSKNPDFQDRDRFVLSAGHGSMLLYSLLHLFGYPLSMDDIKDFRQWGSKTPGHPEYAHTKGVETSTGPLGQGFANAVGMAIAEKHLAAKFNKEDLKLIDHYTYVLVGDGCVQEGIQYEAASLAGTLKLGKLICIYDKNNITIEGDINTTFSEDVGARHQAMGWHVVYVEDGTDTDKVASAIEEAKQVADKPSLIICRTEIGFGCPDKQGKASAHGEPLGEENLQKAKETLGWDYAPFEIPEDVLNHTKEIADKGQAIEDAWNETLQAYKTKYPEDYKEYELWMNREFPVDLENNEDFWAFENKPNATRNISGEILNRLNKMQPNLFGGSADLGPSNKSELKGKEYFSAETPVGSNIHFGIREHAMAAIVNGIYLHGGVTPFCATFFVFTDYMKNAMRMSALMKLPVTYVFTHDSIGVGEDGPTHEPIEQLIGLRSIPGMTVFRPADAKETAAAYTVAMNNDGPTAIVLTRQNLPYYENSGKAALKGGYILADSTKETPDVILMASGSEVEQAIGAKELLKAEGIDARVVSMPSMEIFEKQSEEYKESVLPKKVRARVAVEAGSAYSWYKYVGLDGATVCIDHFGASAPAKVLFEKFGFTAQNVKEKAKSILK